MLLRSGGLGGLKGWGQNVKYEQIENHSRNLHKIVKKLRSKQEVDHFLKFKIIKREREKKPSRDFRFLWSLL